MAKVNDFASELTRRYGLSPEDADGFITMMFDVISEELDTPDKQVKVKGLGTFKVTSVGARASIDVNTGERIVLEGRNKISFTPEAMLRDRVNRPFAQFETVVLNDGVDFSEIDREFDEIRKAENGSADDDGGSATADEDMAEAVDEENDADLNFGHDDSDAEGTAEDGETATETPETETAAESDAEAAAGSVVGTVAESAVGIKSAAEPETGVASFIGAEPLNEVECHACEGMDATAAAGVAVETTKEEPDANADAALPTDSDVSVDAGSSSDDNEPVGLDEPKGSDDTISSDEPVGSDGTTDEYGAADSNDSISFDESAGSDEIAANDKPIGADSSRMVCKQRNPRVMYWLTAASFALLVCIGIGMYFLYRQMEAKNEAIEQLQSRLAAHAEKAKPVAALPVKPKPVRQQEEETPVAEQHPTAAVAAENTETKNASPKAVSAEKDIKKKPDVQVESKKSVEKKTASNGVKSATTASPDYSKDVRIRTGAYVIVGTEATVTVRKGQTLASISKANLGPGMECYVEAYNNVKTVKAGDKLKIPKLKLKKRL